MAAMRPTTAEELFWMPDDPHRFDLIEGNLVQTELAGMREGIITMNTGARVYDYVEHTGIGTAFGAETGFILGRNPDTVLGPDVSVVRSGRMPVDADPDFYVPVAPDLVVEIIFPSHTANYVNAKLLAYLRAGTELIWTIDHLHRIVTVYAPGRTARILTKDETLNGGDVLPGLEIPLADIFDR